MTYAAIPQRRIFRGAPTGQVVPSAMALDLHAAYGMMLCAPAAGLHDLISGAGATTLTAQSAPLQMINGVMGYKPLDSNVSGPYLIGIPSRISGSPFGFTLCLQLTGLLYGVQANVMRCGVGGSRGFTSAFVSGSSGTGRAALAMRTTSYGVADYNYSGTGPIPADGVVNVVAVHRAGGTGKWFANGVEIGSVSVGSYTSWTSADDWQFGFAASSSSNNFRGVYTAAALLGTVIDDTLAQLLSNDLSMLLEEEAEPIFYSLGGGSTFNPAWARGANVVLGAGHA